MKLNLKLKKIREYLWLSQEYVTRKTNIDIKSIEEGITKISNMELKTLCQFYQIPIEKVLENFSCDSTAIDMASMIQFKHMIKNKKGVDN